MMEIPIDGNSFFPQWCQNCVITAKNDLFGAEKFVLFENSPLFSRRLYLDDELNAPK